MLSTIFNIKLNYKIPICVLTQKYAWMETITLKQRVVAHISFKIILVYIGLLQFQHKICLYRGISFYLKRLTSIASIRCVCSWSQIGKANKKEIILKKFTKRIASLKYDPISEPWKCLLTITEDILNHLKV